MTLRDAGPITMAFPSRMQVETVMPRVIAAIAALATFIDPGVGHSGRDPPRQGKAHHENNKPFHVGPMCNSCLTRKPPEPGQVPCADVAPPSLDVLDEQMPTGVLWRTGQNLSGDRVSA